MGILSQQVVLNELEAYIGAHYHQMEMDYEPEPTRTFYHSDGRIAGFAVLHELGDGTYKFRTVYAFNDEPWFTGPYYGRVDSLSRLREVENYIISEVLESGQTGYHWES